MILGIGHVGIAVKNISDFLQDVSRVINIPMPEVRDNPEKKIRMAYLEFSDIGIEVLEDYSESGFLTEFIKKKGEGIHHICLVTDDILKDMEEMKQRGVSFISQQPAIGLRGKKTIFSTPDVLNSFLIELSEP